MSVSKIIVMGVSGCGKSLIGTRLAERLQVPFFDADDFHSPANVAKMASGVPLTDSDRSGWLDDLAGLVEGDLLVIVGGSHLSAGVHDSILIHKIGDLAGL